MKLSQPFERGSISLRIYAHNELSDAAVILEEFRAQTKLGLESGFDGIMVAEHHGGLGSYLPNPLQLAAFVLSDNVRGWAAPAPLLLPLRPAAGIAEEVAWLSTRFPGRLGIGVAAGYASLDFEVMGLDPLTAFRSFRSELPRLASMLRGQRLNGLASDPALAACASRPIPMLSAALSVAAATRAAECDVGLLVVGGDEPSRLAELTSAYDEASGMRAKVLIRHVWLGTESEVINADHRALYRALRSQLSEEPDLQRRPPRSVRPPLAAAEASELAQMLQNELTETGTDTLNLEVHHLPGLSHKSVRQQIARLGSELLPELRILCP
jgi:alkanesulfonate monooxygenase SsuD/methylene tetrahydromethanopterin reductase-like flavin-dependent oxidoreductase (luciferase family)